MMQRMRCVVVAVVGLFFANACFDASAEVRLAKVFADHMVLQHGRANKIWGWADAGSVVKVSMAGQIVQGRADAAGRWEVQLGAMQVSRLGLEMRVVGDGGGEGGGGGGEVVVKDILVGEVWLATGPSNIHWAVEKCDDAKREVAEANYPAIRFFTVARAAEDEPQQDCEGNWVVCSPKTVGPVSGVAYFFSRRLHKEMDMPIGVLQSFWGGSRVESWTSLQGVEAEVELKPVRDWWQAARRDYDAGEVKIAYQSELKKWSVAVAKAKRAGTKAPAKPKAGLNPSTSHHRPGSLFNGMISPLVGYGIRGMITYQGLGNLFFAEYSKPLMRAMLRDWRAKWGQGDFPFGMVQPSPYATNTWASQNVHAYELQRESQLWLRETEPNVGIALTTDIGDVTQLHFTNKQGVGWRMAAWALTEVYGRDEKYLGPVFDRVSYEGADARVSFKYADSGLRTRDGKAPTHFEVAGADGKFHAAIAKINGAEVILKNDRVKKVKAVRFGWSDTADPNLENSDGLPASLFRATK